MALSKLLIGFCLFILQTEINAQEGPPKVTGSFRATGEMVETLEDGSGILVQIAFEESYDADTKNAAFNLWVMGKNVTFIENFETNQTFRYSEGKECKLMTVEEWIKTSSPPSLLNYEDTNGTVRFSLKQLFALDDKYLVEKDIPDEFRGMPARKWMYEFSGLERWDYKKNPEFKMDKKKVSVYAYWSDGTWNTTSNEGQVPLGFVVSKMEYTTGTSKVKIHEQFINVFGFVPNTIDHRLFEPVQGVICEKRKQTLKFPDPQYMQALAFHSEVIFPDYQQINYVDTWYDPRNKLMRQDMERIKEDIPSHWRRSRRYQSEMILGKLGIVYRLGYSGEKVECSIIPIKDFELDVQNLVNFKLKPLDWNIGRFFGANLTAYTYIGKTSKRDIPCNLFQGVRTDWPEPSLKVKSLWEWCFSLNVSTKDNDAVIFKNGEYGLINAQVTILESGSPGDFPAKYRIFHHFYDVNLVEPSLMDATSFDIGRCFRDDDKRRLQFVIDWAVNEDTIYLIQNATSDVNFLQKWKTVLYRFSGIDQNSLRITGVKAMVSEKQLLLKFTILGIHDGLPQDIKAKQIEAFEAEKQLRDNVNKKVMFVNYIPAKGVKPIKVAPVPQTMHLQLNPNFEEHKLPSTTQSPSSTTKKFPFSLKTEPDEDIDSTTSSEEPDINVSKASTASGKTTSSTPKHEGSTIRPTKEIIKEPRDLHKPGTVAAVSIAMILIGITIGGSGVFIKTNGLPACLKGCGAK